MVQAEPRERSLEDFRMVITPQQEQQIRDVARACGADPDLTLRIMRESQVSRGTAGGVSISTDYNQMRRTQPFENDSRSETLAYALLRAAYETPQGGTRRQADLSAPSIAAAAFDVFRQQQMGLGQPPLQISPRTATWLERQAERFHMDLTGLRAAVVGFSALSQTNPDLAQEYLRVAGREDPRMSTLARMFQVHAQTTQTDDGRTSLWLSTDDAVGIAGDLRRQQILGSRITRTA